MKKLLLSAFFASTLYITAYGNDIANPKKEIAQFGIEVDVGDEDYEDEDTVIWVGPGWYYGVWFDNEVEFDDWHDHHHYHHHDHHDHGHHDHHDHHGGHHDGGHHGGGHHSGGHHGGGGHHK